MLTRYMSAIFLIFFSLTAHASAATYDIDPAHSSVSFKVRHLVSWVQGSFDEFEGSIEYDPGHPDSWKAEAVIQAFSIDTNNAKRDGHLRSADFFDVETYPTIVFKSTGVGEVEDDMAQLQGLLTIHGVEKPVTLEVEMLGETTDPQGNVRAGFTATADIDRKDFGLTWNRVLETGQFLVGDEVLITIEIEAVKKM